MTGKTFFISAGEASGDLLGADLITELKDLYPTCQIDGIAGNSMKRLGVNSLFPQEDLSVMGITEVVPRLLLIIKRFYQTLNHILKTNPDIVFTIDSPDFNLRLAKKLKKKGYKGKLIHYVAPTVWAWKEKRAQKMANVYDHVLCLFPFEPPYFERYGLLATYVGHPLQRSLSIQPKNNQAKKLLVLPGSRHSEVKVLSPIFLKVIENLKKDVPDLDVIVPTFERFLPYFKGWKATLLTQREAKRKAFEHANYALAASGTVTLELGLLGVPMVVSYKVNFITYLLAKLLVKTKFVSLVNILLNKKVVPELLQRECNVKTITSELMSVINDSTTQEKELQTLHAVFSSYTKLSDVLKKCC